MSKKSKEKAARRAASKNNAVDAAAKKAENPVASKKKIIIICSVALVLVFALTAGIILSVLLSRDINYMKNNLSRYITISEEDYKGYTLEVLYDEMKESDLDRKIMSLRYQHRKNPLYNGGNIINLNLPINAGDAVKIYYRGYTVDGTGKETNIAGACNFSSTAASLGIGSLGFIPGFEEALVGVKPADYSDLTVKRTGKVEDGDVIYLTYRAMLPDGSSVTKSAERIELGADVDSEYGKGFKEFFVGAQIGERLTQNATLESAGGTIVYFDMTVNYATRGEENPLTINAYFPANYQEASLRGLGVLFDVYFEEVIAYDTPEYNEAFITETLKITEESLAGYDGEGIVEKHKSMLKSEIEKEYLSTKKTLTEEAIWAHLHEKVKIKRLPKNQVNDVYYQYYNEIQSAYSNYYSSLYSTVDEFAAAYLGIIDGTSWKVYIQAKAEEVVTEKLIFYYIIRKENFVPSESEYEARYNELVLEYLDYYIENIYNEELVGIKDEAEREKRIGEIKAEMLDYYGEDYFVEMVYYEFSLDDFISLPTVVKKQ